MVAAVALPVTDNLTSQPGWRIQKPEDAAKRRRLPRIEYRERSGAALHASPLADQKDVLGLNLAVGCVHRCSFCSARAYPNYPGDEVVQLFSDNIQRLKHELDMRQKPRAVYISPSTDPFPPIAAVQEEATRVVEFLAGHGVESWLMTRGYIRPAALDLLEKHREKVKVTIGLTTLDRQMQRILEPWAAPPRLRLRQIDALRKRGIAVRVALEPLVPGLTDTRANLAGLLGALSNIGIDHVTTGYLFLRQGIRNNLAKTLGPLGLDKVVFAAFEGGPELEGGGIAPARYLPKARRQRCYAALMAQAAELGITVRICGITNPDFGPPRRVELPNSSRQLLFPSFRN